MESGVKLVQLICQNQLRNSLSLLCILMQVSSTMATSRFGGRKRRRPPPAEGEEEDTEPKEYVRHGKGHTFFQKKTLAGKTILARKHEGETKTLSAESFASQFFIPIRMQTIAGSCLQINSPNASQLQLCLQRRYCDAAIY